MFDVSFIKEQLCLLPIHQNILDGRMYILYSHNGIVRLVFHDYAIVIEYDEVHIKEAGTDNILLMVSFDGVIIGGTEQGQYRKLWEKINKRIMRLITRVHCMVTLLDMPDTGSAIIFYRRFVKTGVIPRELLSTDQRGVAKIMHNNQI